MNEKTLEIIRSLDGKEPPSETHAFKLDMILRDYTTHDGLQIGACVPVTREQITTSSSFEEAVQDIARHATHQIRQIVTAYLIDMLHENHKDFLNGAKTNEEIQRKRDELFQLVQALPQTDAEKFIEALRKAGTEQ